MGAIKERRSHIQGRRSGMARRAQPSINHLPSWPLNDMDPSLSRTFYPCDLSTGTPPAMENT
jgi:hypothetical protein